MDLSLFINMTYSTQKSPISFIHHKIISLPVSLKRQTVILDKYYYLKMRCPSLGDMFEYSVARWRSSFGRLWTFEELGRAGGTRCLRGWPWGLQSDLTIGLVAPSASWLLPWFIEQHVLRAPQSSPWYLLKPSCKIMALLSFVLPCIYLLLYSLHSQICVSVLRCAVIWGKIVPVIFRKSHLLSLTEAPALALLLIQGQSCRVWEGVHLGTLQKCMSEAREEFHFALPPNSSCWNTASPFNSGVTFCSSSLPCDHTPVSALLFLLQNDGWDCIVLNLQGPRYSLSQQFGGEPVFGLCVGIELKCSSWKQTTEHSIPHRASSEDSFL